MTPTTVVDPRHLINEGETVNRRPRMPASGPVRPLAPDAVQMSLRQLRRFQWAVRATLAVGVAASVSANVLHAQDNLIAQTIAAWPPLALLITVELVSRVPVHRRALAVVRILATTAIAGIAAFVSYQHMLAVASRFGESGLAPYLLPLSVDGLVVVASVSLVELAGRVRAALDQSLAASAAEPLKAQAAVDSAEPAFDPPPMDGAPNHDGHHPTPPLTPTQPFTPMPAPRVEPASADADPDLVALLPAARAARDELRRQGRSLTRDSLAAQLRRDGHTIRTSRVSELLTLLKNDTPAAMNGRRPVPGG